MQSLILIALLQAAMGDPAAAPTVEAPLVEAPAEAQTAEAPAPQPVTRTERRRVCTEPAAATGGRLSARRCRWEEYEVEVTPEEAAAAAPAEAAVTEEPAAGQGGAPAQEAPN